MSKQSSKAGAEVPKPIASGPNGSAERPIRTSGMQVSEDNAARARVPRPSSDVSASGPSESSAKLVANVTDDSQANVEVAAQSVAVRGAASDAIRRANRELTERTADQLALALVVLAEQRDAALTRVASSANQAQEAQDALVVEHDQFVAYLMEEQDAKVEALERDLADARRALERERALGPATADGRANDPEHQTELRRLLEAAYSELAEANRVVARLEEERDEALGAADDVRVELYSQLEATRDESIGLQTQLDEMHRHVEDARDRARDEAIELTAQVEVAQRELDERRGEVANLRERLETLAEEVKHSQPPPPTVSDELSKARQETQSLRRELIDTKRQLSRVTREYEILRTLRARAAHAAVQAGPQVSGPQVSGLQASGPQVSGPQVSGPQVSGPQASEPSVSAHEAWGSVGGEHAPQADPEVATIQELPPQANAGQWPAVTSSVPPPLPANAFAPATAESPGHRPALGDGMTHPAPAPALSGWPPAVLTSPHAFGQPVAQPTPAPGSPPLPFAGAVVPTPPGSAAPMSDAPQTDPASSSNNLG